MTPNPADPPVGGELRPDGGDLRPDVDDIGAHHPVLREDAFSRWLGLRIEEIDWPEAHISLTVRPEMLNGHGSVQGGVLFSFADSCFAIASNDPADTESVTVASGADIDFLRPAFAGDVLHARAVPRHRGRSGLYDIAITAVSGEEERMIALFRGRSRTIPGRPRR